MYYYFICNIVIHTTREIEGAGILDTKKMRKISFTIIFVLLFAKVFSQGCSDAGLCSIGNAHLENNPDSSHRFSAALTLSVGIGEQSTIISQVIPEINFSSTSSSTFQLKVPYTIVHGDLGNSSGTGDLSLSFLHRQREKKKVGLSWNAGVKIPTGNSNRKLSGNSLPMPYQTSLGTVDLIGGISIQYNSWNFTAGYQYVVWNGNKNQFLRPASSSTDTEQNYFESNFLDRGDDALVKTDYEIKIGKTVLSPGLLALYRIQSDKIINTDGRKISLDGSSGLTLNCTCNFQFPLSSLLDMRLSGGAPVIVREYRADGLTRSVVFNLQFQLKL